MLFFLKKPSFVSRSRRPGLLKLSFDVIVTDILRSGVADPGLLNIQLFIYQFPQMKAVECSHFLPRDVALVVFPVDKEALFIGQLRWGCLRSSRLLLVFVSDLDVSFEDVLFHDSLCPAAGYSLVEQVFQTYFVVSNFCIFFL